MEETEAMEKLEEVTLSVKVDRNLWLEVCGAAGRSGMHRQAAVAAALRLWLAAQEVAR